jgi:hypothetical protein
MITSRHDDIVSSQMLVLCIERSNMITEETQLVGIAR